MSTYVQDLLLCELEKNVTSRRGEQCLAVCYIFVVQRLFFTRIILRIVYIYQ